MRLSRRACGVDHGDVMNDQGRRFRRLCKTRGGGRNGDEARRCRLRVSDGIVAARALEAFRFAVHSVSINRRRDRFIAPAAGVLHHLVIELRDLDRVGISAASEIKGMPESVVRLHRIFPHNVVRSVAIVACRHRVVARFHSGVVLRLHHVTVCAGSGIVRQVGISLGINKGISRKPNRHSQNDGGKKTDSDRTLHEGFRFENNRRIRLSIAAAKPQVKDFGSHRLL